jgi:bacterioferritin
MERTATRALGILSDELQNERDEIIGLLTEAYWMELETVMNYTAASINPDGLRAQEVVEAIESDIEEELGHAREFARRIKELYGVVPGSGSFECKQPFLQPAEDQTDLLHIVEGVIEAERGAIAHYSRLIELTDETDPATQDMVIAILRDEQAHLRLFEGFRRELSAAA